MELEFSELIDALPGLIWTALPDGRAEFLNQRWREYTGLSLEQASGFGWHAALHPDDVALVLDRWRVFLASGQPGKLQARLRRHDGEYRRFHFSAVPIADESQRVIKWCGINTDIEDRLNAEEREQAGAALRASEAELRQAHRYLSEAQRLSQTGSFMADVVVDTHVWSEELYRIFELDQGSKISVQVIRNMLHPEDLLTFDVEFARSAAEGTNFDQVFRIRTQSGKVKFLHAAAHVMEQVDNRPVFIGAIQDVTRRKVAEEALVKARGELTHVARTLTLSALTASIAHEVNQPLSGVITNTSTCVRRLGADPPNLEGARVAAQRALRDGNRASEVIQRLRALFARKQFTIEPVGLNEAAREVLTITSVELEANRVVVRTDFAEALPAIMGDRVQLQQVILNLIVNAADAMKEVDDRPRNIVVATVCKGASEVGLSVTDSGTGIDPLSFEKLFDAFYTTKSHGMGVGLSISRSIIESHGGRLWATANDGPGATFSFTLPCLPEAPGQ